MWGVKETGELDVFEGQGDVENRQTFFGTIHDWVQTGGYAADIANNNGRNYYLVRGVDFSQWHTYGVLWVPGRVTWYFDDQPVLSAPTYPIFDEQFYYLMFGAQEGANWRGGNTSGVTASSFSLSVDWVKVWQK
jgi:beta-glucanase (GH16 family)